MNIEAIARSAHISRGAGESETIVTVDVKQARLLLEEQGTRSLKGLCFDGLDLVSAGARSQKWFSYCSFADANLRFSTLDGATFLYCNFTGAMLRGSSLRGASFSGCDFTNSDLRDADLTYAQFSYVNTGTDAGRTVMTGARLSGARLEEVRVERVIGWPGTDETATK